MDINLFSRFKEMKFHEQATLFEVDLLAALKRRICPYCACKLYEMRGKPFWYCRSKKHKKRFIIHKDKMSKIF